MKQSALWLRASVLQSVRNFFIERGFLEVETPLLIPANAPEEHIDPVLAGSWQLQTSPELCMKRLLCQGHERLFQVTKCWRSAERGSRHLTEFTMLEWYHSNADYFSLMDDCEALLRHVAHHCLGRDSLFRYQRHEIDAQLPWRRISVQEAFTQFAHADVSDCIRSGRYEEILTSQVEPALACFREPVILTDYPAQLAALARLKPGQPDQAERFELYLGGLELANGFSELNDPQEQRHRFVEANLYRVKSGRHPLPLPESFLNDLAQLPPSAGIALGIDRLVMLVAGTDTIDDVVAFTPEQL